MREKERRKNRDGSRVLYTYDAGGVKLRTDYYINPLASSVPQVAGGTGTAGTTLKHTWTDYCGNFIYENDSIIQVGFPGGYVTYRDTVNSMEMIDSLTAYTANVPVYHYYVQDHLGNNRVVFDEDEVYGGSIEQINHYYPFGGLMGESRNLTSNQKYKYNGKELDRMHGLDWYDYGARMYDAALGLWHAVDPLTEKYYGTSSYVYCGNNPTNAIDINGDSLKLMNMDLIMAIYNGINNKEVHLKFNNGVLDPESIHKEAENGDDFFLDDLYEIASSDKMVEMYAKTTNTYIDEKGNKQTDKEWGTIPYIDNDYDDGATVVNYLKTTGQPYGLHIQGNTGQTLLPTSGILKRSTNNNVQVIIYDSKIMNCMTVGIAHEFGHVILYLHNKPSGHGLPGVNKFVYNRATKMSRRLGYDY